jgi:hypothetical protein
VEREIRLSMRILYALMLLSMRSISFHVPQAKEQMLVYKFTAQASLMVDPASPRAPNDRYSYLMVEFRRALRYTAVVSFPLSRQACGIPSGFALGDSANLTRVTGSFNH